MATLSSRLAPLTVSVPAMSEWTSYTPTVTNVTIGNGTLSAQWRRVGDSLFGQVSVRLGSTSSVSEQPSFSIPTGLLVDASKLSAADTSVGGGWAIDVSTDTRYVFTCFSFGSNIVAQSNASLPVNSTVPFTWSNTDYLDLYFCVPISGWTSHTASATSANALVVGGQSVGSTLSFGATSNQGFNILANNAAVIASGSTGLNAIKFAPTASVSSDVNTLDDYEEGTWTPSLVFAVPGTGQTYGSNRFGHYQKIGNRVYFHCYFVLASKGTGTGQVSITGLPFTPVAIASGGVSCVSIWSSGISITNNQLTGYVDAPNAQIQLNGTPINADAGAATACTNTHVLGTASLMLTGFYITAS